MTIGAPTRVRRRAVPPASKWEGVDPLLSRLYASRGADPSEVSTELKLLQPPRQLQGIDAAARLLVDAIRGKRRIVIAGDYDADGATATAVAVLGLRMLGAARVDFVVPDRITMGYGLSPPLVDEISARGCDVLVTVDNGIASIDGVAHAKSKGMVVVVTDHHLAGPRVPDADAIVNPNQDGCGFKSKAIAGVGVMFMTLLVVRHFLRSEGFFVAGQEPNLAELLDLVAVGTVADVVRLDHNNRILVEHGLRRIRAGKSRLGLQALLDVAGVDVSLISSTDIGFKVGPRINAAGRLESMRSGIECLISDDPLEVLLVSNNLDDLNKERKAIQAKMSGEALVQLEIVDSDRVGVVVSQDDWHEGVVGLVASRVKDALHRPAIAFAASHDGDSLKGSCRSIPGLHIRDVLAQIDSSHPGLIKKFGGHAMAAGLSIARDRYEEFSQAFDAVCQASLGAGALDRVIETDGPLARGALDLGMAKRLELAGPWGQGFPAPSFEGAFQIKSAKTMGADQSHVKYMISDGVNEMTAVHFSGAAQMRTSGVLEMVYRPAINRWKGKESLDLQVELLM